MYEKKFFLKFFHVTEFLIQKKKIFFLRHLVFEIFKKICFLTLHFGE